jgi:hypothetical protein
MVKRDALGRFLSQLPFVTKETTTDTSNDAAMMR